MLSVGAGLATIALACGLLVRETWELRRLERAPVLVAAQNSARPSSGVDACA